LELENGTERVHETIRERATGEDNAASRGWFTQVALSTLLMALLSALAALMAAISAHESLLERTQEILDMIELENDRVEIEVLTAKHDILRRLEVEPDASEVSRVRANREDLRQRKEETTEEERFVGTATHAHLVFATAVTLLSVGITLGGISMISRKRSLWIVGLFVGLAGAVGVAIGFASLL
jgi:hypothetical protein